MQWKIKFSNILQNVETIGTFSRKSLKRTLLFEGDPRHKSKRGFSTYIQGLNCPLVEFIFECSVQFFTDPRLLRKIRGRFSENSQWMSHKPHKFLKKTTTFVCALWQYYGLVREQCLWLGVTFIFVTYMVSIYWVHWIVFTVQYAIHVNQTVNVICFLLTILQETYI
jgi:hypothetical protein